MECTKNEFENAILYFAKIINKEQGYNYLISAKTNLPQLIKMIAYDIFVNCHLIRTSDKFETFEFSNNEKLLLNYAQELDKMGYVKFK